MDGRAPAEPGWTDALRGVVDEEVDRDCETLDLVAKAPPDGAALDAQRCTWNVLDAQRAMAPRIDAAASDDR